MKKIFMALVLSIFLINLVSASISNIGTFPRNSCIELPQTCTTCSWNNISKIFIEGVSINQTILLQEISMIKSGITYNYTFCDTSRDGEYIVEGHGDLDGTDDSWNYKFEITQTGFTLETSESILYIIILIITLILFLGFLFLAIKLPYSNKTNDDGSITRITRAKYLKLLSIWFAYGFFMWFLQTLNGISSSFIKLTYLSNFITNIFTYSQGFSLAVTFLILIIMFIEVWKDIIISKAIKRYGKAFIDKRLQ